MYGRGCGHGHGGSGGFHHHRPANHFHTRTSHSFGVSHSTASGAFGRTHGTGGVSHGPTHSTYNNYSEDAQENSGYCGLWLNAIIGIMLVFLGFFVVNAVALGITNGLSQELQDMIDNTNQSSETDVPDTPNLATNTKIVTGCTICLVILTLLFVAWLGVFIRYHSDIKHTSMKLLIIIHIANIVIAGVFAAIHFTTLSFAAWLSAQWKEWLDLSNDGNTANELTDGDYGAIHILLGVSAAFCGLFGLSFMLIAISEVVHMYKRRGELFQKSPVASPDQETGETPHGEQETNEQSNGTSLRPHEQSGEQSEELPVYEHNSWPRPTAEPSDELPGQDLSRAEQSKRSSVEKADNKQTSTEDIQGEATEGSSQDALRTEAPPSYYDVLYGLQ